MKTIGIIGLGSMGMRHAKNLASMGHTVYGFDPQIEGTDFHCADNLNWLLSDIAGCDGFVIASPTANHYEHLMRLCGATQKPIFIEKPIAHTDKIGLLYDHITQRPFMCGYNQRFNGAVKQAREWLLNGEIGEPIWGSFTCSQYSDKPAYLREGVILNWSHEIDLALYLLGDAHPTPAGCSTRLNDDADDMVDILLNHKNSSRSSIHLDYLTRPERRGFAIGGTKGWLSASLPNRRATLWRQEGPEVNYWDNEGSYDVDYLEEMQAFIDRIDGKETIGCTGAEALKVLEICLEVRRQAGLP